LASASSRQAMIAARATDTAVTRVFDIAKGLPWPAHYPSRVLTNDFVVRWAGHEEALASDRPASAELAASIVAQDHRVAPITAGQSVGMIHDEASVGEVIEQMCAGAEKLLTGWGS
jgi:nitronate monooxygenase